MTRRFIAAALLGIVVTAGLCVHAFLPDSASSDIAGDVLYAIAVYLIVVLLVPRWRPLPTAAVALVWCLAVELFQLTGIPQAAGAAFTPAMLVLGTVFDPRDLVVYAIAIGGLTVVDAAARSAISGRRRSAA